MKDSLLQKEWDFNPDDALDIRVFKGN